MKKLTLLFAIVSVSLVSCETPEIVDNEQEYFDIQQVDRTKIQRPGTQGKQAFVSIERGELQEPDER